LPENEPKYTLISAYGPTAMRRNGKRQLRFFAISTNCDELRFSPTGSNCYHFRCVTPQACCEKILMTPSSSLSDRALPVIVSMAGVCMILASLSLLIKAASLGIFLRQLLGFIGVIFVNSVILSYVALRISFSKNRDATLGEKVFVMALSVCTGVSLMIANVSGI